MINYLAYMEDPALHDVLLEHLDEVVKDELDIVEKKIKERELKNES